MPTQSAEKSRAPSQADQARPSSLREPESERERRLGNLVIVAMIALVVGVGLWLVNALLDARQLDDCMASGRRDCMQIAPPPSR